ncbi:hypothetical protein EZS27_026179 [termite gut metagenome]|uniref:Endonuclease GajA/Old nuclease/RecF-like AAA domain-containing protein n=1 Tax=termite gut metagenome TaxID=433724 RepID=A0A5J4QRH0_9ZZZZ
MKILFENLGIIKKMELDLSKRLMIFCGQNGTGKTYASYLVYEYINQNLKESKPLFDIKDLLEKKNITVELNDDNLFLLAKEYAAIDISTINRLFGLSQQTTRFSNFKSQLISSKEEFIKGIRSISTKRRFLSTGSVIRLNKEYDSNSISLSLELRESGNTDNDDLVKLINLINKRQNNLINRFFAKQSLTKTYILPVERNSVYTFIDELAVNQLNNLGIENDIKKNRYPHPILNALETAADLKRIKKEKSRYSWLAEEIEKDILHGNISVSEDGELQFTSQKAPDIALSVHLSASVIKNLSGLLIYLKHLANANDLLIIDEPELGLHPDNQIVLARIFAKLIHNNIRLLICTHSDYIIRELNNLIMLSSEKISEEVIQKWGYKNTDKINPDEVGVYLFDFDKDNTNSVEVTPLPVKESGFEVKTIEEAVGSLSDRSLELYYEVMKGKDE